MYQTLQQPNHLIVTWESFNCEVNHDLIEFYRCFIVEPAKTLLTSEVQYNRDFAKINASLAVYFRQAQSKEFRRVLSLTYDICQLNNKTTIHKLANIVYNTMIKNSNYPRKCPQLKVCLTLFLSLSLLIYVSIHLSLIIYRASISIATLTWVKIFRFFFQLVILRHN